MEVVHDNKFVWMVQHTRGVLPLYAKEIECTENCNVLAKLRRDGTCKWKRVTE